MFNKDLTTDQQGLFTAIEKNDVKGAKTLIEKLTPEQLRCYKSTFNQTPLHLALRMNPGDDSTIKDDTVAVMLINKLSPEQINTPDINGDTPLTYAFNSGTDKCIELLINKLSTTQLLEKQKGGKTYEELASFHKRDIFATQIGELRALEKMRQELSTANAVGDNAKFVELSKILCEKLKESIQDKNDKAATLAIEALSLKSLTKGDEMGNTPLHWFAQQRNCDLSVLWSLLSKLPKKALVAENSNRTTPFDMGTIHNSNVGSTINAAYGLLRDHSDDKSLEIALGKDLAKQFLSALFIKPKEICPGAMKY